MPSSLWSSMRDLARKLRRETVALYWAYRDPRTPWYARVWLALVLAYALSPIDLVPDFVPVLGYLDDVVLVPVGIWLALRLIPEAVMRDAHTRAQQAQDEPAVQKWLGIALVSVLWVMALGAAALIIWRL